MTYRRLIRYEIAYGFAVLLALMGHLALSARVP
jgi:hypothetical protein